MQPFYKDACELTLRYRDSKEISVRKTVVSLIPSMATYDSDEFESLYLHRSMGVLLTALSKPTDRDTGYIALSHMSITLGSKMRPFIDEIIKVIKDHLKQRGYV
jgi:FKBP12-rapamycin complex-associated protein